MPNNKVVLSRTDDIAIITLNDPDTLNAMDTLMCEGLRAALDEAQAPLNGYRCILLTGAGRAFSSGANLAASAQAPAPTGPIDAGAVLESHFNPLIAQIQQLEVPLITVVNGVAAGVGMSFALSGDLILAAESAYFLQAFTKIGLVPDGGATWMLPRLIGVARAKELSLLAEKLPAATALDWGLINRVYSDASLMDEAMAMAKKIAHGPTAALGMTRKLYALSPENSLSEQLRLERESQRIAGQNPDAEEGIRSFLQKRSPNYTGRRT